MNICKADMVVSLAGHDKGQLLLVIDLDQDYAVLADGKARKLENPKRKKLKHLRFAARIDSAVTRKILSGGKVLNSELRRDLAIYGQQFNSQNQGG